MIQENKIGKKNKENQIYTDFKAGAASQGFTDCDLEGAMHELYGCYKACAESYEKKLAEKDAEVAKQIGLKKYYAHHATTLEAQLFAAVKLLSEANARNAMLVDALEAICGDRCNAEYNPCEAREAISASSEAVAAWEAEKLGPHLETVRRQEEELAATKQKLESAEKLARDATFDIISVKKTYFKQSRI